MSKTRYVHIAKHKGQAYHCPAALCGKQNSMRIYNNGGYPQSLEDWHRYAAPEELCPACAGLVDLHNLATLNI